MERGGHGRRYTKHDQCSILPAEKHYNLSSVFRQLGCGIRRSHSFKLALLANETVLYMRTCSAAMFYTFVSLAAWAAESNTSAEPSGLFISRLAELSDVLGFGAEHIDLLEMLFNYVDIFTIALYCQLARYG